MQAERRVAGERLLLLGGVSTALASLLHLAIIAGGADWYRFFGAGERMARLAERGSAYPAFLTFTIAVILSIWAAYGLSGARVIPPMPLLRVALVLIAAVYLTRGIFGVPVVLLTAGAYATELRERMTFIVVTSVICVLLGLCYAIGAALVWNTSAGSIAPAPARTSDHA